MTIQRTILSIIFIHLLLCSAAVALQAAEADFRWRPSTEGNISGYKIHYGTYSRNYNIEVDVGLPQIINGMLGAQIDGLQGGQTYYFSLTAYNYTGESGYTTEVEYLVPLASEGDHVGPWTLEYVDSEELVGVDGAATNAFDGDPATIWHTEWKYSDPVHPHQIQINLGAIYAINGMRYLPRQDGGRNGTITKYKFYVSTDGINWGAPVAQGTFARSLDEKEVLFPTVNGQFICLVSLAEINGKAWTSIAELNILYK